MSKGPSAPGPTPEEKALKEVSVAQWNDYVSRFQPAEAELIRRSELTAGERASVKGQAAGDVASSFAGLTRGTIAAGESSGADASSGKTKFALASNADARGRALGLGQAAAETGAEMTRDQQQLGIAALGRNIAADVTSDLSQGARRANRVAIAEAAAKFERNQAAINAAATIAGAATRKYGPELLDKYKDNKTLKKHGMDFKSNWDKNMAEAEYRSRMPTGPRNTYDESAFFKGYNPFLAYDPLGD